MRGERERKKKADNLDREYEEQHSQGQWNSGEIIGSPSTNPRSRASKAMMACLPRAAALLSAYPIAPISPGRDINRPGDYCIRGRNSFSSRGYSGPMISIIPQEVRGKKKDSGFESQEPTSPKVSCIGQVKLRKKKGHSKVKAKVKEKDTDQSGDRPKEIGSERCSPRGAKTSQLKKFFFISRDNKKPEQPLSDSESTGEAVAPSLGQLKRFSCGRDTGGSLANVFQDLLQGDSTCSPTNKSEDSGDEKRSASDDREVENPRNEDRSKKKSPVLISHSGPLLSQPLPKPATTDGQPCEINLWKRRSVAPPMALNLKRSYGLEMRQPSTA